MGINKLLSKDKINLYIKELEDKTYTIHSDLSEMENDARLLDALKQDKIDIEHDGFLCVCPSESVLPNFKCDSRCDKDYTLQKECWKEALKDD